MIDVMVNNMPNKPSIEIGTPDEHMYRGYYDSGSGKTSTCALCSRPIRFCYTMHTRAMKSFILGSCCFSRYEGLKTHVQLNAARILQLAAAAAIKSDAVVHEELAGVRARRAQWRAAKREARVLLRNYRKLHEDEAAGWLPVPLYVLQNELSRKPKMYKRPTTIMHWLDARTAEIQRLTKHAAESFLQRRSI